MIDASIFDHKVDNNKEFKHTLGTIVDPIHCLKK